MKWTSEADSLLRAAARRGDFAKQTAIILGCSAAAIRNRYHKLGIEHRYMNRSLEERFQDYVYPEPNCGCWLWGGSVDKRGYGQIRVKKKGAGSLRYASHVSLEIDGRPVPPGLFALHRCDNPPCVNPDHLFHGTALDNTHDSMSKGRHRKPPPMKKGNLRRGDFCKNGHFMSPDNSFTRPSGGELLFCRACSIDIKRRMRLRRAEAGLTTRGTIPHVR
jgi:hypothetical protein